jgi:hypothetical protein
MSRAFSKRGAERRDVALNARCRTFSGLRDVAELTDISTHGCSITVAGLLFDVGTRIIIQPDGLEGIAGVVRWVAKDRAGVEFDAPLYGPTVEHLSKLHPGKGAAKVKVVGR